MEVTELYVQYPFRSECLRSEVWNLNSFYLEPAAQIEENKVAFQLKCKL